MMSQENLEELMDAGDFDLYTAGTEGQEHLNITMDPSQPEQEDIYTARDESPQLSAPLDIGKCKIKVDWKEPFPERWRARLQMALQTCLSNLEGTASVHRIELMDDKSWAEVQIIPSRALEALKQLRSVTLKFKHENKDVTAWIDLDGADCVTVVKESMLEESRAPAPKVDRSLSVTSAAAGQSASNFTVNETESSETPKMNTETPILPLHLSWYLYNAYSKEMENIGKKYGVTIGAEVSISIKPIKSSNPDSVSKASVDLQKLIAACVSDFSVAPINHKDMDSNIVKEAMHAIKSDKNKLMFTLTDSNGLFSGPKKLTDMIKRETTGVESQVNDKSNVDRISPQSRPSLNMNTKDLQTERDEEGNFRRRRETHTGFNEDPKEDSRHESKEPQAEEETCAICMDSFTDKEKLKCGHKFCRKCINMSVRSLGSICPVCKEVFGKLMGNQPDGTMKTTKNAFSLPGYPGCGTIEIFYNIPSGVQTEKHPNPGMPYYGTTRRAYLPDNSEGNEVLSMLHKAFQQRLIFTVGICTITNRENAVTWSDIHHKTNRSGGPVSCGYPDPEYLKRVKDELKAKGIECTP